MRTTLLHLACTLAVLVVKAGCRVKENGGVLGENEMRHAVRDTDLMLSHHADPESLTALLGFIEGAESFWDALA